MVFSLFNRKSEVYIEKSLNKYKQILQDDINSVIRTRCNGRVYTSDIEYLNNREVLFRCPIDKYDIIRFDNQSIIEVDFVSCSGLYTTELLITEKIIEDNVLYYKGEIRAPIEKNNRRKNYRLPVVLDLNYTILPRERIEYSGNTLDISVDGMLMETCENIYQSKNIKIKIDIDGKTHDIKSTIIKKRTNFRNGKYLYNLKFDKLSKRHKNEISRFIFDNKNTHSTKPMENTTPEK
ncbi:PilZ domain-containing protein [[Clostridium] dakarense]|uniref:PilZ domain-containing protein n=1 Tax=Faecalimicrobium dakarense TaxID=1301100 RepID=UPI0004B98A53|nr:PilZ domain-containing protein [[Clostridium] dakarense]